MPNQQATPALGLNFSHRYASLIGLDPAEAFLAVLIHLKPVFLRLSLYWDEISPEAGVYDFSAVHWHLQRAQQHGCRVLLTVGFKPQRHPSFAAPRWLSSGETPPQAGRLAANLLLMLERAIALLADYDAIDAWEVEHEPFVSDSHQPQGWSIDSKLVQREIDLLGEVDPRHRPVVVSHPAGHLLTSGWRKTLAAGDVFGWVYAPAPNSGSSPGVFTWVQLGQQSLEARLQAMAVRRAGKSFWITELSVESSAGVVRDSGDGRPGLGSATRLLGNSGAERAYLLGTEQWLLERERGEPDHWNWVRSLLRPELWW
jgi:hypothetical protein